MTPPLVSCLLPTRDRPAFLRQALRCFARQTYPNRELLVLDNGTREVRELCEGLEGVHYLGLGPAPTIVACMTAGAELARGAILQKLDDDDYYAPGFLARAVSELRARKCDVVAWDCFYVHVAGDPALRFSGHGWGADGSICFTRDAWLRSRTPDATHFETMVKKRTQAKVVRLCAPELYMVVRHGRHRWNRFKGNDVTEYFRSRQPARVRLEDIVHADDLPFYAALPSMSG
jgi:glycosyltransferase involved in cell wall biosynthesis